jgi:hypothetical protein
MNNTILGIDWDKFQKQLLNASIAAGLTLFSTLLSSVLSGVLIMDALPNSLLSAGLSFFTYLAAVRGISGIKSLLK